MQDHTAVVKYYSRVGAIKEQKQLFCYGEIELMSRQKDGIRVRSKGTNAPLILDALNFIDYFVVGNTSHSSFLVQAVWIASIV